MNCLTGGFGEPSELLEPSGVSGVIWSHLESSAATWSYLDLSGGSGAIWNHLEPSGVICRALELSGAISTYLEASGAFWIPDFLARLAPNAGLAAPVVTVGAWLIWSVVESESHIQKTLLKLIRNPIFSVYELSHRRFWEPSELLEPSGDVSSHLEPSGVISGATQSYLDLSGGSGAIWNHLKPSGVICSALELSGAISISGTIWRHLRAPGAIWRHIEPSGVVWSHLKLSWPIWEFSQGRVTICYHVFWFDVIRVCWIWFD